VLIVAFQSGELRTPEGTTTEICQQISLVLGSGATEKLKSATASTGVRDSITTSIVETLVDMGKKLRKRGSGKVPIPEADIRARLEQELNDYLGGTDVKDMINPLLGMKGECSGSSIIEYTSSNCTSRDEYSFRYTNGGPPYNIVGCGQVLLGADCFLARKGEAAGPTSSPPRFCGPRWIERAAFECSVYLSIQGWFEWETLQELSASDAIPNLQHCSTDCVGCVVIDRRTGGPALAHPNRRHREVLGKC